MTHSPWRKFASSVDRPGVAAPLQFDSEGRIDVAIMPSRAEGGTNLVAAKCMACGVPEILSRNTGHLDLIEDGNRYPLEDQRPIGGAFAGLDGIEGYCESQVDEVVARLEQVFGDRAEAKRRGTCGAQALERLTWSRAAANLKRAVLEVAGRVT